MVPGPDHLGASNSFTARRPNASHLGTFELPPPPLASLQQKYPTHSYTQPAPVPTTLTSVGNLLTPPSNGSSDGLSPVSSIAPSSNNGSVPPYTPSGSMWHPPHTTHASYGSFHSSAPTQHSFGQGRGLFSPSLNSIIRGSQSPTASEALPPPPYEIPHYSSSMPTSAPSLPAVQHHHQMISSAMVGGQPPVSTAQASPVHSQDTFSRHTPTNSYHSSQPPTPSYHHSSYPTSAGQSYSSTSHAQHSPVSAMHPLNKPSPVSQFGSIPSLHSQSWSTPMYGNTHRPYFPSNGAVLPPGNTFSGLGHHGNHLSLVGSMPQQMGMPMNSGQMAQMQQLYGHQASHHPNPANDRPFRCDQCTQSFNRNHDLKRHKRIHLAVKPFPCGHCDKSFSRKDALKRHVLVKGCGKAHGTSEAKEMDGSSSPNSDDDHRSPPVQAS